MPDPGDKSLPKDLEELVEWAFPDLLWLTVRRHSAQVITLWTLDLDYSYREWLACLGDDGRWTLSPRS